MTYKGTGPVVTDLLGAHIPLGIIDIPSAEAALASGKVRALAISSSQRFEGLPDLPTFQEAGLKDFEAIGFLGMLAPAGVPPDALATINRAFATVLRDPEVLARFKSFGSRPMTTDSEGVRRFHRQRDQEVDRGGRSSPPAAEVIIPATGARPCPSCDTSRSRPTTRRPRRSSTRRRSASSRSAKPARRARWPPGYFLSDGTLNIAILKFKTDQIGKGMDYTGVHHFGVLVDDPDKYTAQLEALGAECFMGKEKGHGKGFFEIKFKGPDGTVFDIAGHPWMGSKPLDA